MGFTKQVLLNCDWNSTQFCITPVWFNHSAYNWKEIKFHLQDIHKCTIVAKGNP